MLANGAGKTERCSCLAVEVGMPGDALFFWQGDQPRIGGDATVVAIGAQGVACAGGNPNEERRRPSISAIDLENADVVIEVEDLPDGRPLASGAIVPRPGAGGGASSSAPATSTSSTAGDPAGADAASAELRRALGADMAALALSACSAHWSALPRAS